MLTSISEDGSEADYFLLLLQIHLLSSLIWQDSELPMPVLMKMMNKITDRKQAQVAFIDHPGWLLYLTTKRQEVRGALLCLSVISSRLTMYFHSPLQARKSVLDQLPTLSYAIWHTPLRTLPQIHMPSPLQVSE